MPIYDGGKRVLDRYCFVHFDGPHDVESILREFEFFEPRMPKGAAIVFDDIKDYDHERVERAVLGKG